jgi:hypothetical protein
MLTAIRSVGIFGRVLTKVPIDLQNIDTKDHGTTRCSLADSGTRFRGTEYCKAITRHRRHGPAPKG